MTSSTRSLITDLRGKMHVIYVSGFAGITQVGTRTLTSPKQEKLTKRFEDLQPSEEVDLSDMKPRYRPGRTIEIDVKDFKLHPLWDILLETVRSNPRFANLAGYARQHVLSENPEISPKELASKLSITVGEALAILDGADIIK